MGGGITSRESTSFGSNGVLSSLSQMGGNRWGSVVIDDNRNLIAYGGYNQYGVPVYAAVNFAMSYGPLLNCGATGGGRSSVGAWNCTYCDAGNYGLWPSCDACLSGYYCPGTHTHTHKK
jgi:hypothetical protein